MSHHEIDDGTINDEEKMVENKKPYKLCEYMKTPWRRKTRDRERAREREKHQYLTTHLTARNKQKMVKMARTE